MPYGPAELSREDVLQIQASQFIPLIDAAIAEWSLDRHYSPDPDKPEVIAKLDSDRKLRELALTVLPILQGIYLAKGWRNFDLGYDNWGHYGFLLSV